MAKAINWPLAFRDEVLAEDTEQTYCAFRLGRLYYDNSYWVPGEIVDIRVNHLKVRKAEVIGSLLCAPLRDLPPDVWARQKSSLQTLSAMMAFLSATYRQPVDEQTEVTVVTYRNHPVIPEELETQDDPHL